MCKKPSRYVDNITKLLIGCFWNMRFGYLKPPYTAKAVLSI